MEGAGGRCKALGVLLKYLSNDMVAYQKSEVLASEADLRGGALAESRL